MCSRVRRLLQGSRCLVGLFSDPAPGIAEMWGSIFSLNFPPASDPVNTRESPDQLLELPAALLGPVSQNALTEHEKRSGLSRPTIGGAQNRLVELSGAAAVRQAALSPTSRQQTESSGIVQPAKRILMTLVLLPDVHANLPAMQCRRRSKSDPRGCGEDLGLVGQRSLTGR